MATLNRTLPASTMAWLRRGADRTFVNARFVAEYDAMLAPLRTHPEMPGPLAHMERRAAEIAAEIAAEAGA